MPKLAQVPEPVLGIMRSFALGRWGENIEHFADDASLIAFLDDGLQAVLEGELSPIVLNGAIAVAGYTARVAAAFNPMSYDVISVSRNGFQVATEVEWTSKARKTGSPVTGRSCSVWTIRADHKIQSLFTASWLMRP